MTLPSDVTSREFRHKLYDCDNKHGNIFFMLKGRRYDELLDEVLNGLDNNDTVISYKNNGGCILHLVSAVKLDPLFFSELRKVVTVLKESSILELCDIIEVYEYSCTMQDVIYSFILNTIPESKTLMYRSDAAC